MVKIDEIAFSELDLVYENVKSGGKGKGQGMEGHGRHYD